MRSVAQQHSKRRRIPEADSCPAAAHRNGCGGVGQNIAEHARLVDHRAALARVRIVKQQAYGLRLIHCAAEERSESLPWCRWRPGMQSGLTAHIHSGGRGPEDGETDAGLAGRNRERAWLPAGVGHSQGLRHIATVAEVGRYQDVFLRGGDAIIVIQASYGQSHYAALGNGVKIVPAAFRIARPTISSGMLRR